MSEKPNISELLKKNPHAQKIFEENLRKVGGHVETRKSDYNIGLPYAGNRQMSVSSRNDKKAKKNGFVAQG